MFSIEIHTANLQTDDILDRPTTDRTQVETKGKFISPQTSVFFLKENCFSNLIEPITLKILFFSFFRKLITTRCEKYKMMFYDLVMKKFENTPEPMLFALK